MHAKWGALLSCCLSCFIAWLDYMIVNTALPAIQTELSASFLELQWVMNAFILAMIICIITMGRIADLWGRKLINLLGVLLFGLASLFAGLAQTPHSLIICRFFQGVASAAIIPSSLALIAHAFPLGERGKAMGIWSGAVGLGMALGPVLGGILVSALSWRWIFFINVPIAILSTIMNLLLVEESHSNAKEKKIDWKGFCLLTLGLCSLISGIMHAPDWGWKDSKTMFSFALALVSLVWFYQSENKTSHPTIPFELFSNSTFLSCALVMFGIVFIYSAALFFIPLYLIEILHQKPYVAGLFILPFTASIALLSPFGGHMGSKISAKKLILGGFVLYSIGVALQLAFDSTTTPYLILGSLLLMGIGWAAARPAATTKAVTAAPSHLTGTGSGVLWSVQNTGGALGIAIAVTVFRRFYEASLTPAAFFAGYHAALWILLGIALLTILNIRFLMKDR